MNSEGGRPDPAPVSCNVWWATAQPLAADQRALLSPFERDRSEVFRQPGDRNRSLTGAWLLRRAVGDALDTEPAELRIDRRCAHCGEQHGAPRVLGHDVHVSVSHSGQQVAVAVATGAPVGVDVEQISAIDLTELRSMLLAPTETASSPSEFFQLWVRKEAVVKATGDGLGASLSDIAIGANGRVTAYPGRLELVAQVQNLTAAPGYAAAVALLTAGPVDLRVGGDLR